MIKLSFCFQPIPFLENSLFSVHIINVNRKNDHACQSKCHAKCRLQIQKIWFWKKKCIWFWKTKTAEVDSWVPSLRQEESLSMNAGLGGGWGEALKTFLWKPVRLDCNWGIIHESSRTFKTIPYFLLTLLFVSPSSLLWQSVWFLPT